MHNMYEDNGCIDKLCGMYAAQNALFGCHRYLEAPPQGSTLRLHLKEATRFSIWRPD